jgi:hypothetical protein
MPGNYDNPYTSIADQLILERIIVEAKTLIRRARAEDPVEDILTDGLGAIRRLRHKDDDLLPACRLRGGDS